LLTVYQINTGCGIAPCRQRYSHKPHPNVS
jgi:hypothetical protein